MSVGFFDGMMAEDVAAKVMGSEVSFLDSLDKRELLAGLIQVSHGYIKKYKEEHRIGAVYSDTPDPC